MKTIIDEILISTRKIISHIIDEDMSSLSQDIQDSITYIEKLCLIKGMNFKDMFSEALRTDQKAISGIQITAISSISFELKLQENGNEENQFTFIEYTFFLMCHIVLIHRHFFKNKSININHLKNY